MPLSQQDLYEMDRFELYRLVRAQEYQIARQARDLKQLMRLIPPCRVHGPLCVPHALDWITAKRAEEFDLIGTSGG